MNFPLKLYVVPSFALNLSFCMYSKKLSSLISSVVLCEVSVLTFFLLLLSVFFLLSVFVISVFFSAVVVFTSFDVASFVIFSVFSVVFVESFALIVLTLNSSMHIDIISNVIIFLFLILFFLPFNFN